MRRRTAKRDGRKCAVAGLRRPSRQGLHGAAISRATRWILSRLIQDVVLVPVRVAARMHAGMAARAAIPAINFPAGPDQRRSEAINPASHWTERSAYLCLQQVRSSEIPCHDCDLHPPSVAWPERCRTAGQAKPGSRRSVAGMPLPDNADRNAEKTGFRAAGKCTRPRNSLKQASHLGRTTGPGLRQI